MAKQNAYNTIGRMETTGRKRVHLEDDDEPDEPVDILDDLEDQTSRRGTIAMHRQCTVSDFAFMSEVIAKTPGLIVLDLSGTGMNDDQFDRLTNALRSCVFLNTLDLRNNKLTFDSIGNAESMKNAYIKKLLLSGNPIKSHGVENATRMAERLAFLTHFSINIGSSDESRIDRMIFNLLDCRALVSLSILLQQVSESIDHAIAENIAGFHKLKRIETSVEGTTTKIYAAMAQLSAARSVHLKVRERVFYKGAAIVAKEIDD